MPRNTKRGFDSCLLGDPGLTIGRLKRPKLGNRSRHGRTIVLNGSKPSVGLPPFKDEPLRKIVLQSHLSTRARERLRKVANGNQKLMFIVFDGIDGAGKSTQIGLTRAWLSEQGRAVDVCFDPGSTVLGLELRRLLLTPGGPAIAPVSEMLMFTAARAQLVEEVIRPALERGSIVLCDRYIFSTVVYQGYAGGVPVDKIWQVNLAATGELLPHLTLLFDLPAQEALRRLTTSPDRMESRGIAFFECVRQGFLSEAERWPSQVAIIDATQSIADIQNQIREAVKRVEECART